MLALESQATASRVQISCEKRPLWYFPWSRRSAMARIAPKPSYCGGGVAVFFFFECFLEEGLADSAGALAAGAVAVGGLLPGSDALASCCGPPVSSVCDLAGHVDNASPATTKTTAVFPSIFPPNYFSDDRGRPDSFNLDRSSL